MAAEPTVFAVDFSCTTIASSSAEAFELVAALRQVCQRAGFDPGPGRTRALSDRELASMPAELHAELAAARERARFRHGAQANDLERAAAMRGLVAEAGGDLATAEHAMGALERSLGYLPRGIARELARSAPPRGAAA